MNKVQFRGVSLALAIITIAAVITACNASLNERQKGAIKAFDGILAVMPVEEKDGWFQLISPDGGATFAFSNDNTSLCIDAAPFIAAGLDTVLIENVTESIFYKADLRFSLAGWNMLNPQNKDSASAQFKANIRYYKVVETDETFKINFADDNNVHSDAAVFEWAKNIEASANNIIFTLNAEPLIAAGVDPEKIEAWDYVWISDGTWAFQKAVDVK